MPTPLEIALDTFLEVSGARRTAQGLRGIPRLPRLAKDTIDRVVADPITENVVDPALKLGRFLTTDLTPIPPATPQIPSLSESLSQPQTGAAPGSAEGGLRSPLPVDPRLPPASGSFSPLPGSIESAPPSTVLTGATVSEALAPAQPRSVLGLDASDIGALGLSSGSQFLSQDDNFASSPRTGVLDSGSLTGSGPFAGGAGGQLTFGDGTSIGVSGELSSGLTINNPFVDASLSRTQQNRVAEQQGEIQRVAAREKRKRVEEAFRLKWQRARRVLNEATVPLAAKRQIERQLQMELQEIQSPDPLELFDTFAAEDSPEIKLTRRKQFVEEQASLLYGSEDIGRALAGTLELDDEGRIDYTEFDKSRQVLESRRAAETSFVRDMQRQEAQQVQDRNRSVDSIRDFAEKILDDESLRDNPESRAAVIQRVAAHQSRFGQLPGPPPQQGDPFNAETIYKWLYNVGGSTRQRSTQPQVVSGPNVGSGSLFVVDTIQNATPADEQRAIEEVARLRAAGQPNATIRVIRPDGTSWKIQ